MLTRVWQILSLALGLPDGRLSCIVFIFIIIGENYSLFSPQLFSFSLLPCSLRALAACWSIPSLFLLPSSALAAGAAVLRWGSQKSLHLLLVPALLEGKRVPPLPVSPTVAGGDR